MTDEYKEKSSDEMKEISMEMCKLMVERLQKATPISNHECIKIIVDSFWNILLSIPGEQEGHTLKAAFIFLEITMREKFGKHWKKEFIWEKLET